MKTAINILKRLRALGLSQSEIARRTGIPQPKLSRWESGLVPSGADDALKLSEFLQSIAVDRVDEPSRSTQVPES